MGISLNEGRGLNPGDTLASERVHGAGYEPLNEGRGLNPGDTRARACRFLYVLVVAQRRPGPKPRRHFSFVCFACSFRYAQRRPGPKPRRHVLRASPSSRKPTSLNEGRGLNPGDTIELLDSILHNAHRSTKAGA